MSSYGGRDWALTEWDFYEGAINQFFGDIVPWYSLCCVSDWSKCYTQYNHNQHQSCISEENESVFYYDHQL